MKSGEEKRPKKKVFKQLNADTELQKFGKRIKQLRINKGYSNYEHFAYDHNISRAQYGRYENGQDLRYSTIIKIISAFEISVAEFFAEGFD